MTLRDKFRLVIATVFTCGASFGLAVLHTPEDRTDMVIYSCTGILLFFLPWETK